MDCEALCSAKRSDANVLSTIAGTWQAGRGEVAAAVSHSLAVGYRHIDAAFCYQNEEEVGQGISTAIKEGKAKREDIFVATKLWCTYHTRVEEGLELSLKNLGLDYVDLFLMHWPIAMNPDGKSLVTHLSHFCLKALRICLPPKNNKKGTTRYSQNTRTVHAT